MPHGVAFARRSRCALSVGRGPRRRLTGIALAAVAVFACREAAAQAPRTARLVYVRGPGTERCPDEEALRNAVAARLGYDPFRPDATTTVEAAMARSGRGLRARIEARDAEARLLGTRTLSSGQTDCTELAAAVTLALSIAIDPLRTTPPYPTPAPTPAPAPEPPPPEPPAVAPAPPPATPPTAAVRAPPPSPRPRATPLVFFGGGALVAFGTAPAATPGFYALVGLRLGAASLALELRADLPASVRTPSGGEVDVGLLVATLVPCARIGVLALCALGSVGTLRGTARDATGSDAAARQGTELYAAAGVRAAVEIPVHRLLALRAHADGVATLTRTTVATGASGVWTTPVIAGSAGLGVVVTFR